MRPSRFRAVISKIPFNGLPLKLREAFPLAEATERSAEGLLFKETFMSPEAVLKEEGPVTVSSTSPSPLAREKLRLPCAASAERSPEAREARVSPLVLFR